MEKKNPKIRPDLSGAKLRKTNLSGAILTKAILEGAIFEGTIFEGTSFQIATHKGGIFKGDRVEILGVQKTIGELSQAREHFLFVTADLARPEACPQLDWGARATQKKACRLHQSIDMGTRRSKFLRLRKRNKKPTIAPKIKS